MKDLIKKAMEDLSANGQVSEILIDDTNHRKLYHLQQN